MMMMVEEPDGSGIDKKLSDNRFLCHKVSFLLLTPVGASKCYENIDTG